MIFLDCTLRDGGYYNAWDFSESLILQYLDAMKTSGVDVVELGFRSLKLDGFRGACAYTTDNFLQTLPIPDSLSVSVMINAGEILGENSIENALTRLFPNPSDKSPVNMVRVACHVHEFKPALQAAAWLKEQGYRVGFNLMQIAERSDSEISSLAAAAESEPVDVLYFADSMGSLTPTESSRVIHSLKSQFSGEIGVHTHDNMNLALANTLKAHEEGATWLDSTVAGMGRGPGNTRTEELAIEVAEKRGQHYNLVPLMGLIRQHFKPLQEQYRWGANPYYYLAGKYGIHPTYIQKMLDDSRYDEEDVLAVIDHLRLEGGKSFNVTTLDAARQIYQGTPSGQWHPSDVLEGKEVLVIGTGPSAKRHQHAIERFIQTHKPVVIALNTESSVLPALIDYRIACHPVRMLADCNTYSELPQPLITPYSMLPTRVQEKLASVDIQDFGLTVSNNGFEFHQTHAITPSPLVIAYALATVTSGHADRIFLAGFDGYQSDDPRMIEMQRILQLYETNDEALQLTSLTETRYEIPTTSVYGLL